MKIVITDGNAVNPGDLSWDFLNKYGQVVVYPRTPAEQAVKRLQGIKDQLLVKLLFFKCKAIIIDIINYNFNITE